MLISFFDAFLFAISQLKWNLNRTIFFFNFTMSDRYLSGFFKILICVETSVYHFLSHFLTENLFFLLLFLIHHILNLCRLFEYSVIQISYLFQKNTKLAIYNKSNSKKKSPVKVSFENSLQKMWKCHFQNGYSKENPH